MVYPPEDNGVKISNETVENVQICIVAIFASCEIIYLRAPSNHKIVYFEV